MSDVDGEFIDKIQAFVDRRGHGAKGVLADQVNISRQHLYDILKGRSRIGAETRERIEAVLKGRGVPTMNEKQTPNEELIQIVADELELLVKALRSDALDIEGKVGRIASKMADCEVLTKRIRESLG